MQVHRTLGNGFSEVIYQRALAIELEIDGLDFVREQEMTIYYRDQNIGIRRVDFLVEESVIVELKSAVKLEDIHIMQAKNYLEVYQKEIGLLINFGARSLEFKRIYNREAQQD